MDPRQMVALRKALESAPAAPDAGEGPESAEEMAPPMLVQCPGCGEQFDANAPEAQIEAPAVEPPTE